MRVLDSHEILQVSGAGNHHEEAADPAQYRDRVRTVDGYSGGGAPLGSATAGEYFDSCLAYVMPSASWGAAWTLAGAASRYVAWSGVAYTAGAATVCGLGTIQYAQ